MFKVSSSQFNYLYGNQIHFPYSIARLIAYVKTNNQLSSNFQFLPTFIYRDELEKNVLACKDSDILLCSCYVWNWEITLTLAKKVKELNPNCLIIFGGPLLYIILFFFNQFPTFAWLYSWIIISIFSL